MANLNTLKKASEDARVVAEAAAKAAKEKAEKEKAAKEKAAKEKAAKEKAAKEKAAKEKAAKEKAEKEKAEKEKAAKEKAAVAARLAAAAKVGSRLSRTNVEAILDAKAEAKGVRSNWRDSLTDLMKTMNMNTSLASRKALAAKLNYSGHAVDGSAEKDTWLHAQLFKAISQNGGELPPHLL